MIEEGIGFLEQICYNNLTTNVMAHQPIATQKNISYHYQSPARLLLHRWYSVIGSFAGLYFWGRDMSKKLPVDAYHELANDKGLKFIGEYSGDTKVKATWECKQGHCWQARYNDIYSGYGCPICAGKIPKTLKDYEDRATSRGFRLVGELPKSTSIKTTWECNNGHQWCISYDGLRGCPYCVGNAPKTSNDYNDLAELKGLKWIGEFPKNTMTKTTWTCSNGHRWEANYDSIRSNRGCPYCYGRVSKKPEDYHRLAKLKGIKWVGDFPGNTSIHTLWQCKYGHKWLAVFGNIRAGYSCPICKESRGEKQITNYLNRLGVRFNRQKKFKECKYKNCLPFDFYIEIFEKRFLIEYQGEQHFTPIDFAGKGNDHAKKLFELVQVKDNIKVDFAKKYGFVLILIPYTEKRIDWFLKTEIEKCTSRSLNEFQPDNSPRLDTAYQVNGWQLELKL